MIIAYFFKMLLAAGVFAFHALIGEAAKVADMKGEFRTLGSHVLGAPADAVRYEGQRAEKKLAFNGSASVHGLTRAFRCTFEITSNRVADFLVDASQTATGRQAKGRPAFDRTKASTAVVKLICADERHPALDRNLDGLYAEAMAKAGDGPLADTEWRLVEVRSMNDEVGTVRPEDPYAYTMRLNGDGTVTMRLNCNRASGKWSAEPSADISNGRFWFGPLAVTRALCPPPSLDEQIAEQAKYIRGYLLRDGRLYLSLFADGGIWGWEPVNEVRFLNARDPDIEAAILRASPDYTRDVVEAGGGSAKARYIYGKVDLNADGQDEVFAYPLGSIFCGTGGCNLMLFRNTASGYRLVNTFPISRLPVIVSPQKTKGWNDLFRPESGGGAPPSYVRHTFDGERYVERERLPGHAKPQGVRYLAGDFTFSDGIPLEPRK